MGRNIHQRHEQLVLPSADQAQAEYDQLGVDLNFTPDQKDLISEVLNKYGSYSSEQLVFLTHSELPWNEAREGCDPFGPCKIPINLGTMKEYYTERLKSKVGE